MLAALPLAAGFTLELARWLPSGSAITRTRSASSRCSTLRRYPLQQETFWLVFAAWSERSRAGSSRGRSIARRLRPQTQASVEAFARARARARVVAARRRRSARLRRGGRGCARAVRRADRLAAPGTRRRRAPAPRSSTPGRSSSSRSPRCSPPSSRPAIWVSVVERRPRHARRPARAPITSTSTRRWASTSPGRMRSDAAGSTVGISSASTVPSTTWGWSACGR